MFLRRRRSFTLRSERFTNSNKFQLVYREYNPNRVKKWNNSSTLCVHYDGSNARAADRRNFRFSPNSRNGSWFQHSYIPVHVEQPLEAILVKMFRTNYEPAFRIEFFFGVSKQKLSISRPLFAADQCREIPAAGFDELLQPWTTQRLIMPQEHAKNKNYLIVFRISWKYTYFSQRKLPFCILN